VRERGRGEGGDTKDSFEGKMAQSGHISRKKIVKIARFRP
jgi:hypothetical protein